MRDHLPNYPLCIHTDPHTFNSDNKTSKEHCEGLQRKYSTLAVEDTDRIFNSYL
jgi:hypothetical protein